MNREATEFIPGSRHEFSKVPLGDHTIYIKDPATGQVVSRIDVAVFDVEGTLATPRIIADATSALLTLSDDFTEKRADFIIHLEANQHNLLIGW